MEHPRKPDYFQKDRKEIYHFVRKLRTSIANKKRLLLVIAEVKAGKREISEALKVEFPGKKGYYFTSLNRKDVQLQKAELEKYEIETYVISAMNDDGITALINEIKEKILAGAEILFFWDECDYGSGSTQKLSTLFNTFLDTPEVIHILVSATAHETLFSKLADRSDFEKHVFEPPPEYKGAKYFLDSGLVFAPKPFIEKQAPKSSILTFTAHAYEVMRDSFKDKRNIGCVRISGKGATTSAILGQVPELKRMLNAHFGGEFQGRPFKIKVIDSANGMNWEDSITRRGYTCEPLEANWLFIINQTCTRGTDLKGWHPNLAFWHDVRHCSKCNLNTLLQAILRPSHYSSCYKKETMFNGKKVVMNVPQPIRLYVDRAAVLAATGDFSQFKEQKGKAPTRMAKTRNTAEYEHHESEDYASLKVYFDAISQPFPLLSSFPKEGEFYKPQKVLGIREEDRARTVWDYEHAARLRIQENRRHHYFVVPSYRDLSDASTIVWHITRKLSKQEVTKAFETTGKSMYQTGDI